MRQRFVSFPVFSLSLPAKNTCEVYNRKYSIPFSKSLPCYSLSVDYCSESAKKELLILPTNGYCFWQIKGIDCHSLVISKADMESILDQLEPWRKMEISNFVNNRDYYIWYLGYKVKLIRVC